MYVHLEGVVTIDEMTRLSTAIVGEYELPGMLRILEFAHAELAKISLADLYQSVAAFMKKNCSKFEIVRHAVVTDNPLVTAYILLLGEELRDSNYSIRLFSTERAAKLWLSAN